MGLADNISKSIYGKSSDPKAEENQSAEFKDGYQIGLESILAGEDLISREWFRRGKVSADDAAFREWKRGMWAAIFRKFEI